VFNAREGTLTGHASLCGRILVVDDDLSLLECISTTLESAGFTIVCVTNGPEALEVCRGSEPPDLVVLDVQLPGMSGYEICRELRDEFGEGLPILFVSGFRTEALDRVAGLLVGGDDYLVKPFAPDELIGRVRVLTRRTRGLSNGSSWGLTRREDEVLRLLASGLRQEEIASRLVVSPRTVGAHIQNVLRKMGATSRTQAVALAYRRDLRTS
jgi:DNA-binding response OmpR family regulator